MYPSPNGGGTSGKLPGDYQYKVNDAGQLELWKGDVKVAMQSPNGSWFRDSIGTGVGSLHLGGNESGGVAHSVSSAGQNVGFKNEFSNADPDKRLFFYPPWQAVSVDGTQRLSPSARIYGSLSTNNTPNGAPHSTETCEYNFQLNASGNSEIYAVTIIPVEDYSGPLHNSVVSNLTGAEIYATFQQVALTSGVPQKIKYDYPFSLRAGDSLQIRLIKDDGEFLQVRSGSLDTQVPYRMLETATFTDADLALSASGLTASRMLVTDGNARLASSQYPSSTLDLLVGSAPGAVPLRVFARKPTTGFREHAVVTNYKGYTIKFRATTSNIELRISHTSPGSRILWINGDGVSSGRTEMLDPFASITYSTSESRIGQMMITNSSTDVVHVTYAFAAHNTSGDYSIFCKAE